MSLKKSAVRGLIICSSLLSFPAFSFTCLDHSNCPQEISELQIYAKRKVPDAQLLMGLILREQYYVESAPENAFIWFKKAARKRPYFLMANHIVGKAYLSGEGTEVNLDRAIKYLSIAATQGYVDSQRLLGFEYLTGKNIPADTELARYWLWLAAEQNDLEAASKLIESYQSSSDKEDTIKVAYWQAKSKSFTTRARDLDNQMKIDSNLIAKVIEKSRLWVKGKLHLANRNENLDRSFSLEAYDNLKNWPTGPRRDTHLNNTSLDRRVSRYSDAINEK